MNASCHMYLAGKAHQPLAVSLVPIYPLPTLPSTPPAAAAPCAAQSGGAVMAAVPYECGGYVGEMCVAVRVAVRVAA